MSDKIIHLSDDSFDTDVLKASGLVLVDFLLAENDIEGATDGTQGDLGHRSIASVGRPARDR